MRSIESVYQSKLGRFYSTAEQGAARFGTDSGVFSDILGAIEKRFALGAQSTAVQSDTQYAISDTPSPLPVSDSNAEIDAAIEKAAQRIGLDTDLIRAVIQAESSFRPDAVSYCGAQGLMQLMPGTAQGLGVQDPFDVDENVMGGTRYLQRQLNNFGDIRLSLAAYNAGPGKIGSLGITDPDDPAQYSRISSGVRSYVDKVLSYWNQFKEA